MVTASALEPTAPPTNAAPEPLPTATRPATASSSTFPRPATRAAVIDPAVVSSFTAPPLELTAPAARLSCALALTPPVAVMSPAVTAPRSARRSTFDSTVAVPAVTDLTVNAPSLELITTSPASVVAATTSPASTASRAATATAPEPRSAPSVTPPAAAPMSMTPRSARTSPAVTPERPRTEMSPAAAVSLPVRSVCVPLLAPSPARRQIALPAQGSALPPCLAAPAVTSCTVMLPVSLRSSTKPREVIAPDAFSALPALRSTASTPVTAPTDRSSSARPRRLPVPLTAPTAIEPPSAIRSMSGTCSGEPLRACVSLPAVTPVRPCSSIVPSLAVTSPTATVPAEATRLTEVAADTSPAATPSRAATEAPLALVTSPRLAVPSLTVACNDFAPRSPAVTPVRAVSLMSVDSLVSDWPVHTPPLRVPMQTLPEEDDRSIDSGAPPIFAASMPKPATLSTTSARRASSTPVVNAPAALVAASAMSPLARTPASARPAPSTTMSWSASVDEPVPAFSAPVALTVPLPPFAVMPPAVAATPASDSPLRAASSTSPAAAVTLPTVADWVPPGVAAPACTHTDAPLQGSSAAELCAEAALSAPTVTDPEEDSMSMKRPAVTAPAVSAPSTARSTTAPVVASAPATVTAERPRTRMSPEVATSAPVSMSCAPLVAPSPARRQIALPLQGSVSGASLAAPAVMPCRSSEPPTLSSCTKPSASMVPAVSVPPARRSISLTPPIVPADIRPEARPYSSPLPVMSPTVTAPAADTRSMLGASGGAAVRAWVSRPALTPVRPCSSSLPSLAVTSPRTTAPWLALTSTAVAARTSSAVTPSRAMSCACPAVATTWPTLAAPCAEPTSTLRTVRSPAPTPVLPCSVRSVSLVSACPVQTPPDTVPRQTLPPLEASRTDCGDPSIFAASMPRSATLLTFKARRAVSVPVDTVPSPAVAVRSTSRCALTSPSANPVPTITASWSPVALPAVTSPAAVSTMPASERISTRPASAVTAPPVVTPSRPAIKTSPTLADTEPVVSVRPLPSVPSKPAPRHTALPSQASPALAVPPALTSPTATLPRPAATLTCVAAASVPASTPSRPSSETRPDRAVTSPAAKPPASVSTPILTLPAPARTSTVPAVAAAKDINAPPAVSTLSVPPTSGSSPSDSTVPATIDPDFERSSTSATCGAGASTRACETSPASMPSRPSSSTVPSRAVTLPTLAVKLPSPSDQGSEPAGGSSFAPAWMSTTMPSTSPATTLPAAARNRASRPAMTLPTSMPSWPCRSTKPAKSRSDTMHSSPSVDPTQSLPPVETRRRLSGRAEGFSLSSGSNSSFAALVMDTVLLGAKAEMSPKRNIAGSGARDSSVSAWAPSSSTRPVRFRSPTEMPRPFSEMLPAETLPGGGSPSPVRFVSMMVSMPRTSTSTSVPLPPKMLPSVKSLVASAAVPTTMRAGSSE